MIEGCYRDVHGTTCSVFACVAAYDTVDPLFQAERYYNCAHEHKRAALQPFHGLVQLYRRTGAHDKHAQALRHVLATGKDEASKYATRVELVKALIHSNQPMEASEVLIAIEHALHLLNEDDLELPEEVSILKADCQIALDETEYNNRIQITLEDAHSLSAKNSSRAHQDDDLLIQEVAATWVCFLLHSSTSLSTAASAVLNDSEAIVHSC